MKTTTTLLVLSLMALSSGIRAEDEPAANAEFSGDIWTRSKLTGDWGGIRNDMAEHGVTLDLDATHTTQHVISGGFDSDRFSRRFPEEDETESAAMFNMLLKLDTGKAGLWPGGFLTVRGEGRVGESIGLRSGGLMPSNGDALSPVVRGHERDDVLVLSELTYAQFLSEQFGVAFGLLNTAEGDNNEFAGSLRSRSHFMNSAMRFSPVVIASVPMTSLGVMTIFLPNDKIIGQAGFINSEEAAGYDPFEVDDGTTFLTEWKLKYGFADLPGSHTFGFVYGFDRNKIDIGSNPRYHFGSWIREGAVIETNADTWALYYNGDQYIQGDKTGGWGVFLRAGVSDGHPNPIKWNTAFGIGGVGVGSWRPNDNWGIGGYALGASNEPLVNSLGINDEAGFEAFYNVAVAPWLHITGDIQYVSSALSGITFPRLGTTIAQPDDSWTFSLRTNWNF